MPITIDLLFRGQPGVVAAYLLTSPGHAALVETGPSSTLPALLAGIERAGVALESIREVLVTHVHLDHSGAAGLLLRHLPNATLYAHERGVPHLIDPAKLVASAARIYGALMGPLWGEVLPVPAERLVALRDGDTVWAAGRRIEVLYTPGHASHHVAFRMEDDTVFTGDVGGIRLPDCAYVRPPTPPPDLDLELWDASIERLAAIDAPAFYPTHFGRCEGTAAHLRELRARLRAWEALVLDGLRSGQDRAAITTTMRGREDAELLMAAGPDAVVRYETAGAYAMNVSGYERYLRKRHPDLG